MAETSQILAGLKDLKHSSFTNETERVQVEQALRGALRRVQRPFDVALDHCWAEPITTAFLKQLIDTGLFTKWVDGGADVLSLGEISALSGVEEILLKRVLRYLCAQELMSEADGKYGLTDFTKALGGPDFPAMYTYLYEAQQPSFANWPKFAAKTGQKNPTDPGTNNFADWYGGDFFSFLGQNPKAAEAFNKTMTIVAASKVPWVDIYPTANLVADAQPGKPLVVDVAGGVGHDLEQFRSKHPETAGQLVLQDLQKVVDAANVVEPVQKQGMDLLAGPNPVKGARAYYIKTVLHDWPDSKAVEILQNIAASMEKGYSRILVHETVLSRNNSNPRTVNSDATMMLCFSASEREEATWRDIIDKAGLRIVKIWAPDAPDSIVELDLA